MTFRNPRDIASDTMFIAALVAFLSLMVITAPKMAGIVVTISTISLIVSSAVAFVSGLVLLIFK